MTVIHEAITNEEGQIIDIYMEVDDQSIPDIGRDTRGGQDVLASAQQAFTKSMQLIHACAEQVAKAVNRVKDEARPDGFEVQIALKIDGEWGAVIAKTGAEASIQVTLKWESKKP